MIDGGGARSFKSIEKQSFDLFFYGLGYESRSTKIASCIRADAKIFAFRMPEIRIHSYERNLRFAQTNKHIIVDHFGEFISKSMSKLFERAASDPLRIGFDVSSINRIMLVETLACLSRFCRPQDRIEVFYCPAAYQEPDWQFPQIEKMGPVNSTFSIIDTDPLKPLCLLFGAGFEAGISMGLISQLEPRLSFCFWGTGVDSRFDRAVRRANFNFEFESFNAKEISYNIRDPKAAFLQLESIVFGLIKNYRVIIVPQGPKLFTFLTALVGMSYLGHVAVWRVQYMRTSPADSLPGKFCVSSILNTERFKEFASQERELLDVSVVGVAA